MIEKYISDALDMTLCVSVEDILWALLWVPLGALAVSLGNTAASRLGKADDPKSPSPNGTGFLGEEILQALSRLLRKLLSGSHCDKCGESLSTIAVVPLIGCWIGCPKCCGLPNPNRMRYFLTELIGGIATTIAWFNWDQCDTQALATILLVPFLLSFMLSLKELLYPPAFQSLNMAELKPAIERIVSYYLTSAFALLGLTFTISPPPRLQVIGLVLFGWIGWIIGLAYRKKCSSETDFVKRAPEIPTRCFAVGMISGATLGFSMGVVWVVLVTTLICCWQLRRPTRQYTRYLEETVLIVIFAVFFWTQLRQMAHHVIHLPLQ